MAESDIEEYKTKFLNMQNDTKWYLRFGHCVEDQCFQFAQSLEREQYVFFFLLLRAAYLWTKVVTP